MEFKKSEDRSEPEIVYSRSVKAGKRIYYLDVKKARNEDLYLCITESKRRQGSGNEEEPPQFEKHKLFLYKEDFNHFAEGLTDVIGYVRNQLGEIADREERTDREADVQPQMEVIEEQPEEEKPRRGLFGLGRRK